MVAGVLLFLVMVDTFLTGWLLKSNRDMQKVVAELGNVCQVHSHDIEQTALEVEVLGDRVSEIRRTVHE